MGHGRSLHLPSVTGDLPNILRAASATLPIPVGRRDPGASVKSTRRAAVLAERLGISKVEVERRVALVMSGGTEGVMSPHATVFAMHGVQVGGACPGRVCATQSRPGPAVGLAW